MAHDHVFARIQRAFPNSVVDSDGSPIVQFELLDAKGDPVVAIIDQNGAVEFDTDASAADMLLSVDNLHAILRASRKAASLMGKWFDSDAGRAWAEAQNF
jgi:hypothetical protein